MGPGTIVGKKYRITQPIGEGAMGQVWAAVHTGTDKSVAIKFLQAKAASSPNARHRFQREAKASARISHENVVDVFDVGDLDDGSMFLVMELLDGIPLSEALLSVPTMRMLDFLTIIRDTARALSAAHAVGIVHRDVKPANIFLHRALGADFYTAKVLDFGISKFLQSEDGVATAFSSVLGSPRYMSPEHARSAKLADPRSDMWSLGVVMFESLTGQYPHEGDTFVNLAVNISTLPPKDIKSINPRVPPALCALVEGCLSPLDKRIQSAEEFISRLEPVMRQPELAELRLPVRGDDDETRPMQAPLRFKAPTPDEAPLAQSDDDEPGTMLLTDVGTSGLPRLSDGPDSGDEGPTRVATRDQVVALARKTSQPDVDADDDNPRTIFLGAGDNGPPSEENEAPTRLLEPQDEVAELRKQARAEQRAKLSSLTEVTVEPRPGSRRDRLPTKADDTPAPRGFATTVVLAVAIGIAIAVAVIALF